MATSEGGGVPDVEAFLASCAQSGDAAYGAAEAVLQRLQNPASRGPARRLLGAIRRRFFAGDPSAVQDCFRAFHFRIHEIILQGIQQREKLTVMEIPGIFIPEDWSFTFDEGLNRHPHSTFRDKTVSQLGCGNGLISIALAEKWSPSKVYGLDINPRAIKIAWINLYLNALDGDGLPIYDREGKTLLDRVEFHESDLLSYCRDNKIELDCIVGCIPQILNSKPEAMSEIITEDSSEDFLSDYCYLSLQGSVEDQFGLGLIARAVEEAIAVIKPMGILIFNMGGRPGQGVCERLFLRRGLRINKLCQTKIMQAADTDISALVEIEKNSPHCFEFFMDLVGDQPV